MEQKYHFIITRYCPMEQLFDGEMTFPEAKRFMDEHASEERRVGFKVFNDIMNRWEDYKDSFHGGRKVYDKKGDLYILDPDYRDILPPESQRWHLWYVSPEGERIFLCSFRTKEQASAWCDFRSSCCLEGKCVVEPSDIKEL